MLKNPDAGNGVIKENSIKLHSWNNGKLEIWNVGQNQNRLTD
jgi:hypothetical protein